jgi:uncharacterized protein (TIGR03503 family)
LEITKLIAVCFLLFVHVNYAVSQETEKGAESATSIIKGEEKPIINGKIDFYQSDNLTNEIPYFDNRFRIDAEIEEITLIFFRTRGSKPIILVQPDGKKVRISDYDREKVKWHDDRTFDMINISQPMPGPWQAIGDILPKSKILVVSDVKIAVDPLPEIVLSGETLKVVGELFNGNEKVDVKEFRDVVQLDVNFFSTNNSAYDNFGADALKLTSFQDDGEDLDEYAGDNLYTGEFLLDFAAGEWQPVFLIKLPLKTRELRQKPILLHKSPITISVDTSETENTPHNLVITIDPTHVNPSSLVFQGKTTFPDKQTKPFSIMDGDFTESPLSRIEEIPYTEPGIHRVNLSAFGRTISGREFRLVVPEFTFNVKGDVNKSLFTSLGDNVTNQATTADNTEQSQEEKRAKLAEELAKQKTIEEEENTKTIIMIAAGNGIIIILALVVFVIMRKRKAKK